MSKYLILIGDGMADEPIAKLGHKTILEYANTPAMDYMATHGTIGLVKTVPDGFIPGSDTANLSIFGYDPNLYYTGRAPIEAVSMGIKCDDQDYFLRCNLVTVIDGVMVDFSGGHISSDEGKKLIDSLNQAVNDKHKVFYPGKSYRNLLKINKIKIKATTIAPHDITGQKVIESLPKGEGAEAIINLMEISKKIFADHPVNIKRRAEGKKVITQVWLWGGGFKPVLPTYQKRFGLTGAVITAVDLIKGIGYLAGFDYVQVDGATGYYDTDYSGKINAAIEALKTHDVCFVHVEAPDEAGHMGDIEEKIRAVENFDSKIVQYALDNCTDTTILVLPDHPTPINKKTHTADLVPFVVYDKTKNLFKNSLVKGFTEQEAKKGSIILNGSQLLERIIREEL